GLRGEQGLLERLDRGYVGLGRARAHGDAKPGAPKVGAAAGHHFARLDQCLYGRRIADHGVEALARAHLLDQVGVDVEMKIDLVTGRFLELAAQLARWTPPPATPRQTTISSHASFQLVACVRA